MSKNRKVAKLATNTESTAVRSANNQTPKLSSKQVKRVDLLPRNTAQEKFIDQLFDESKRLVFAIGPAGTGKSYLSTLRAIKSLKDGEIDKIIIVRPAVGAEGENHGFLPGDLNQKLSPWLQPLIDIFEEHFTKPVFKAMVDEGIIEFSSLMYMRGRSFKNAVVIFDEAENSLPSQMKLLLTRLGENTRAFITGDLKQTDHRKENGLLDFIKRLKSKGSKHIAITEFLHCHIERDPIVAEVLNIYGDEDF